MLVAGFSLENSCFFITVKAQTGWNQQKNVGSFQGGQEITAKFSLIEAAQVINLIKANGPDVDFYHKSQNGTICSGKISFVENEKTGGSFFFNLNKGESKLRSFLSIAEALDLAAYLEHGRTQIYSFEDIEEDRKRQEAVKQKNQGDGFEAETEPPPPSDLPF